MYNPFSETIISSGLIPTVASSRFIELSSLIERVDKLGYKLSISKKAKDFICEKGFDEKNGARPLNRMIQKYIEDLIAKNLVSNKIKAGDNLLVDYKSNSNELNLLINKKEKAS